jgi:hypothetical protein
VDPIGLTLGLAGLSGLWSIYYQPRSSRLHIRSKILPQRLRPLHNKDRNRAATSLLLGPSGGAWTWWNTAQNLQNLAVQWTVWELFRQAICFLEDSEVVKKRHGAKTRTWRFISFVPGRIGTLHTLGAGRENSVRVSTAVDDPRGRAGMLQRQASTLKKVKWAFSGIPKSERLLQELGWFLDRLHALLPISGPQTQQQQLHQATNPPRVKKISGYYNSLRQSLKTL